MVTCPDSKHRQSFAKESSNARSCETREANTLVLGECFANLPSAFCVHMVSRFIHCQKIGILPKRDGYLNFLLLATGELGKRQSISSVMRSILLRCVVAGAKSHA